MYPLNWKVMTLSLSAFSVITYLLCVGYGLLAPETLHPAKLLEGFLPGFTWLTYGSFVLGLIETLVYGAYAGALSCGLYNYFLRLFAPAGEKRVPISRAA